MKMFGGSSFSCPFSKTELLMDELNLEFDQNDLLFSKIEIEKQLLVITFSMLIKSDLHLKQKLLNLRI